MRPTGDYRFRFQWQAHSYGTPSGVGDPTDVYATAVPLWGDYEGGRVSTTVPSVGQEFQASNQARIRLRNFLTINALDLLTDPQSGEVWIVTGSRRTDNETLVDVYY